MICRVALPAPGSRHSPAQVSQAAEDDPDRSDTRRKQGRAGHLLSECRKTYGGKSTWHRACRQTRSDGVRHDPRSSGMADGAGPAEEDKNILVFRGLDGEPLPPCQSPPLAMEEIPSCAFRCQMLVCGSARAGFSQNTGRNTFSRITHHHRFDGKPCSRRSSPQIEATSVLSFMPVKRIACGPKANSGTGTAV